MTDTTLRIERIVNAAPAAVFAAWTTPELVGRWYKPHVDFVVTVTELDVRVGGRYDISFGPAGQDPYRETGTYAVVDAPHKLVMSETLHGDEGIQWADTQVTVELFDEDGKTRMVLTHEGFPSVERRDGAAGGWPQFLDTLDLVLAAA